MRSNALASGAASARGLWLYRRACAAPLAILLAAGLAHAQPSLPPVLRPVGFDQRLDEQVPLDLEFRDEAGRAVRLGDCFGGKPVILVLAYFKCPMLCTEVLNGLVRALLDLPLEIGKDFRVVTVSFDPRETPEMAAAKKKTYLERFARPGAEAGWHFLTGEERAIRRLTEAVGFRYVYDPKNDQFAHASGIVVLTPAGKVSRYFYDIRYSPRDLRLGLVEASAGRIGSPVDRILLYCFHYDPLEGKYGPAVMNFVRLGGVLTLLALGTFMAVLWRRERKAPSPPTPLPQRGEGSKK
jgi:protein SCO1/2